MSSAPTLPYDPKFKSSRGFTIMEVALAATVLSLTLVGMIGVVESGSATLDLSRKQTIAGQILHQEVDSVHLQSWSTVSSYAPGPIVLSPVAGVPAGSIYDPILQTFAQQYVRNYNYPSYSLILLDSSTFPFTVSRVITSIEPKLLQVTFAVTWTGLTGRIYTRYSTTYVTQNGLNNSYQRS
jgi:hypothetical protein